MFGTYRRQAVAGLAAILLASMATIAQAASIVIDASGSQITSTSSGFTNLQYDGGFTNSGNGVYTEPTGVRRLSFSGSYVANCFCGNLFDAPTIYFTRNGVDVASYSFSFLQANFQFASGNGVYREATSNEPLAPRVANFIAVEATGDYILPIPERYGFSTTIRFGGAVTASPAPEPATWGMMLLGFGVVGASMRRPRAATAAA